MIMEKEGKKKKPRNEKRSPLQDLNGLRILKPNTKKSSNLSSSSSCTSSAAAAAVSGKASRFCSRLLLSSNSCSSYSSSSSSSSRTHLDKKLKTFPKLANKERNRLRLRSKENEIPSKPFLGKSRRTQQDGRNSAKPTYKNGQKLKLSSVQDNGVNKLKKGSEQIRAKMKNSRENGSGEQPFQLIGVANNSSLNCVENCTPVAKVVCGCGLQSVSFSDHVTVMEDSNGDRVNDNSATPVKTPPVEASLSPEIQCQSHSKVLVLKSAATPVCYGAGHLVSGVTDKRKCRRRGSLKGGCEKANLFDDERSDGIASNDLPDPSIPLLSEASVRWLLSPRDEGHEDQGSDSTNKLDQCRMVVCDDASANLDVISSPSTLRGNASDLFYGIGSREGKDFGNSLIGDNSALSTGSLSSGNVIQTPNSDSRADLCVRESRLEVHHSNLVWSDLGSIRETLDRVNLSPRSEMSMWDLPVSYGGDLTQLQNNVDSVSSWVSDATLNNLALSQMRISWRDGLVSRIVETDELDCCCLLSDEEIDGDDRSVGEQGVGNKENVVRLDDDNLSPMLLDYEPHTCSARGKEKSLLHRPNICAESISTDGGGGLLASDDST